MPELIEGIINGQRVQTPKGRTILEAVRALGLVIPTLCHHQGLPPEGNCRVCLAEINGRLAASCMYPLRENGFTILTDSPAVRAARRFVLEMLVNSVPQSPRLLALAAEYGAAPEARFFGPDPADLCIRCGRCTRACEISGHSAISLVGRGRERRVTGPFLKAPEDCVGCRACAEVCPTGMITYTEKDGRRFIWGREFELARCEKCGQPFAAVEELPGPGRESMVMGRSSRNPAEPSSHRRSVDGAWPQWGVVCGACRRRELAEGLKAAFSAADGARPQK